jgi:hypothetical protein
MKLRSTILQKRSNSLMLLMTEQEIVINLNLEDIIDDIKNSTERRMVL